MNEYVKYAADDLILCLMNDQILYNMYYGKVKKTTTWKTPKPIAKGAWKHLIAMAATKFKEQNNLFKCKEVRAMAIDLIREHYIDDATWEYRNRLDEQG
jgi:hypothetical protein